MSNYNLEDWQRKFRGFISVQTGNDVAHDLLHIERVVKTALELARAENANMAVVLPAAWLHDCVHVPKDSAERSAASKLAADYADKLLRQWNYPFQFLDPIHHAIEAHSFSAKIKPKTLEAQIIQDADRLERSPIEMSGTDFLLVALFCRRQNPQRENK